eukprot:s627_g34.t1
MPAISRGLWPQRWSVFRVVKSLSRPSRLRHVQPCVRHMSSVDGSEAELAVPSESRNQADVRIYRPMTETVRTYLNPAHFFMLLRAHGTDFFAGVPDSLLKDICAYITDNVKQSQHARLLEYLEFASLCEVFHGQLESRTVIAANEGTALAMAAGHHLATGKIACVYLQNSGLGNTINPLLSLCSQKVYAIPALLLIGWRGEPGKKDEPQHLLQGALTPTMLQHMGVPYEILPDYAEGAFEVITKAYAAKEPFALLVKKETFEKYRLSSQAEEILEEVIECFPSSPLVTTTGFTSREMFELRVQKSQSHRHDFLTVGSMGHCSSIALGVALSTAHDVLCIDGDGAALMHMGSFATIAKCRLKNFKHVLINNAVHDSVGGQPTGRRKSKAGKAQMHVISCDWQMTGAGSVQIDFPGIARACGYQEAMRARSSEEVKNSLRKLKETPGPCFLEVQALPGARADLGRPTTSTHQNKEPLAFVWRNLARGDRDASLQMAAEQLRQRCQWMDGFSSAALGVAVGNFRRACPENRANCLPVLPSLVRQQRRARQMYRAIEAISSQNVLLFLQVIFVCIKTLCELLVESSVQISELADPDWSDEERQCVHESDELQSLLRGLSGLRRLLWRLGLAAELFMPEGEGPVDGSDAEALQELQASIASSLAKAKASWAKLESDIISLRLKIEPWQEGSTFEAGGCTNGSVPEQQRTAPLCRLCLLPAVPLGMEAEIEERDPGAVSAPWRGGHWHVQCANFWLRHASCSKAFKDLKVEDPFEEYHTNSGLVI